jgi:hypothetical protein
MKVSCPSCDRDISEFEFSREKWIDTKKGKRKFTDIGFECENCGITIYKYYIEEIPLESTEEEDVIDFYKYSGSYDGVFSREFMNRI